MTIVEVMVALAIIAMVLAFAGPSAMQWIQNVQLRNAAEAVLGGVQQARIEALKRNTVVAFQLTDPLTTAYRVCIFDPVADDCSATDAAIATRGPSEGSNNARVGVETALSDTGTALNPGDNIPSLVAFDPFGRVASNSPINIARIDVRNPTLATGERRMSIIVAAGGQVRMCDPQLSKATNPQGCQ